MHWVLALEEARKCKHTRCITDTNSTTVTSLEGSQRSQLGQAYVCSAPSRFVPAHHGPQIPLQNHFSVRISYQHCVQSGVCVLSRLSLFRIYFSAVHLEHLGPQLHFLGPRLKWLHPEEVKLVFARALWRLQSSVSDHCNVQELTDQFIAWAQKRQLQ